MGPKFYYYGPLIRLYLWEKKMFGHKLSIQDLNPFERKKIKVNFWMDK